MIGELEGARSVAAGERDLRQALLGERREVGVGVGACELVEHLECRFALVRLVVGFTELVADEVVDVGELPDRRLQRFDGGLGVAAAK